MPLSKLRNRQRMRKARSVQPNLGMAQVAQNKEAALVQPSVGVNQVARKLEQVGIQLEGNQIVGLSKPMIRVYRPGVHYQTGEHLLYQGREIVVPEVDADGYPMLS